MQCIPSLALIRSLAVKNQMLIGAGLIERADDDRLYNAYVACLPDDSLHTHRKLHAFRGPNGRGWLMRWLPARAHDNGVFILFSNGVGADEDEVRTGNAMMIDPYGSIIEETWAAGDAMVSAELDLTLLAMSTGRRWIHGRRPELYQILTEPQGYERDARTARFSVDVPQRNNR